MMAVYWVELQLAFDPATARAIELFWDKLLPAIQRGHHSGHVTATSDAKAGTVSVAMTADLDDDVLIEQVPVALVSTVRAAAHDLGYSTAGWPEPPTINDVRTVRLDDVELPQLQVTALR